MAGHVEFHSDSLSNGHFRAKGVSVNKGKGIPVHPAGYTAVSPCQGRTPCEVRQ